MNCKVAIVALAGFASSLALGYVLPFLSAQTTSRRPNSPLPATQSTPGWKMNDDEFRTFLLQIETILPIYESSLSDLETYIGKQQSLPYRTGKVILDDVQNGRKDVKDIRESIATLRDSPRSALEEIFLEKEIRDTARDELDIERDELDMAFAEYQLGLKFPSPSGLRGCRKQFLDYADQTEKDYMVRILFLESQHSRNGETH